MRSVRSRRVLVSLAVAAILVIVVTGGALASITTYKAHLAGRNEVPAVNTRAQGQAIFHKSADGTSIDFKLIVANIEDVTQAHIHCGSAGVNGPVVVFLYGLGPTVTTNGILSQGTITEANVISRPNSDACPGGVATLEELIAHIEAGNAYVNVHTIAYPGGEIRGQMR